MSRIFTTTFTYDGQEYHITYWSDGYIHEAFSRPVGSLFFRPVDPDDLPPAARDLFERNIFTDD